MSLIAVEGVSSIAAVAAAVVSVRNLRNGPVSRDDLWLAAAVALFLALLLAVYVIFWAAALEGNFRELLLPDLLATRPKRTMFTVYIFASAGLAIGFVAMFATLFSRGRKA
jgi:hypothetical protein